MDEWYERQKSLFKKISKAFLNFKKTGSDNITKGTAKARLEGLLTSYQSFCDNDSRILSLSQLDAEHLYFKSGLTELNEEAFFNNKGMFLDFLETAEEEASAVTTAPAPTQFDLQAFLKHSFAQILWEAF